MLTEGWYESPFSARCLQMAANCDAIDHVPPVVSQPGRPMFPEAHPKRCSQPIGGNGHRPNSICRIVCAYPAKGIRRAERGASPFRGADYHGGTGFSSSLRRQKPFDNPPFDIRKIATSQTQPAEDSVESCSR